MPHPHLLLAKPRHHTQLLHPGIHRVPQTPKRTDQTRCVRLVDLPRRRDKLRQRLPVVARLVRADARRARVLVALEQLQVPPGFLRGPREDQGQVVDHARLRQLLEGLLVVLDVDHAEEDAQRVGAAPEVADAAVDVLRVQAVVFEGEEERAGGGAEDVVGLDVGVLPGEGADVGEDRVAFLARVDEDESWGVDGCGGGVGASVVGRRGVWRWRGWWWAGGRGGRGSRRRRGGRSRRLRSRPSWTGVCLLTVMA